jgi:hypothetical protein
MRWLLVIVTIDSASLHYESDFLQDANIGERIAGHRNDVSKIAGLECADLIRPSEEFGPIEEACLESSQGGHAVLDHKNKFTGLCTVGKGTNVRTDRHRNSSGELFAKFLGVKIERAVISFGLDG